MKDKELEAEARRLTPEQYEILAARRHQWDALLWQVPTLSLTGQAFLLVIALGGASTELARLIAAGLGLVLSVVSMMSLSRHRISETSDAHFMQAYERVNGIGRLSGTAHKARRDSARAGLHLPKKDASMSRSQRVGRFVHWIPDGLVWLMSMGRAYPVWLYTFALFGVVELGVVMITLVDPSLLAQTSP